MPKLSPLHPKTLIISLQAPAEVFVESSSWDITAHFRIRGIPVDGNDTPWLSFADLLIDLQDRRLVGLTFQIDKPEYWEPMQQVARRLDPKVAHYNDISTAAAQQAYPGEAGKAHRFEITWATATHLGFELAQLNCGQWFWWYAMEGDWGISRPLIALGITDLDEVLNDHSLSFPESLVFPPLDVAIS